MRFTAFILALTLSLGSLSTALAKKATKQCKYNSQKVGLLSPTKPKALRAAHSLSSRQKHKSSR